MLYLPLSPLFSFFSLAVPYTQILQRLTQTSSRRESIQDCRTSNSRMPRTEILRYARSGYKLAKLQIGVGRQGCLIITPQIVGVYAQSACKFRDAPSSLHPRDVNCYWQPALALTRRRIVPETSPKPWRYLDQIFRLNDLKHYPNPVLLRLPEEALRRDSRRHRPVLAHRHHHDPARRLKWPCQRPEHMKLL